MRIYVDATTLIALGSVGELDLLSAFDGTLVVLPSVRDEVTTEPARTNLDRFLERGDGTRDPPSLDEEVERAQSVLDEPTATADVRLLAAVIAHLDADESVAMVSDDRRLRTVARGLGARVTGTIGVVVRAVEEGLSGADGRDILERVDRHGLHMTAELRAKANELVDAADE